MKPNSFTFRTIIFVLMLMPVMLFGQARLQVIHNSADVAAAQVDVWLNVDKNQQIIINVSDLPSGLYVVTLNAGNSRISSKIQVVN